MVVFEAKTTALNFIDSTLLLVNNSYNFTTFSKHNLVAIYINCTFCDLHKPEDNFKIFTGIIY